MASTSASWRPHASAASNHVLMPMPVVATKMSTGSASSRSVAARSSASSTWLGSCDSDGAHSTCAPRRSSSAICSSTLRAAVTPTR